MYLASIVFSETTQIHNHFWAETIMNDSVWYLKRTLTVNCTYGNFNFLARSSSIGSVRSDNNSSITPVADHVKSSQFLSFFKVVALCMVVTMFMALTLAVSSITYYPLEIGCTSQASCCTSEPFPFFINTALSSYFLLTW